MMGGDDKSSIPVVTSRSSLPFWPINRLPTAKVFLTHEISASSIVSSAKHVFPGTWLPGPSCDLPSLQPKRQRHFRQWWQENPSENHTRYWEA